MLKYLQRTIPKEQRILINTTRLRQLHISGASKLPTIEPDRLPPESSSDKEFDIDLPNEYFKTYRCDGPDHKVSTSRAQLIDMLDEMIKMRRLEIKAQELYLQKYIRGFCHLATGQEAVYVGMENSMTKKDLVIGAYRIHTLAAQRGATIREVLAELLGKATGNVRGKGGSMHYFTSSLLGGYGILGASVPLATGVAFARKYNSNKNMTMVQYGDGAAQQGQIFEAYNMAKLWNLPIVYCCENNGYGMGTSIERHSANPQFYKRGDLIPGIQANGMDALSVMKATQFVKEWTTSGKGPIILEVVSYRFSGHSVSDPGTTYRTKEEVQSARKLHDPINRMKEMLLGANIISKERIKELEKSAAALIEQEAQNAINDPYPPVEDLATDVYVPGHGLPHIRGREKDELHFPDHFKPTAKHFEY